MPDEVTTQEVETQTDAATEPMTDDQLAAVFVEEPDGKPETTEGQTQEAAPGSDGTVAPAAEPTVDLGNGVKATVKDVLAWQASHGKVTQEFQTAAKMRKDLEPLMTLRDSLRANKPLAEAVVRLMDRKHDTAMLQRIAAVLSGQPDPVANGQQQSQDPRDAKLASYEQRLASFEADVAQQKADAAVVKEFDELKESNPELGTLSKPEWAAACSKIAGYIRDRGAQGYNVPIADAYAAITKANAAAFAFQKGQEDALAKAARDRKAPAPKVKAGVSGKAPPPKVSDMGEQEQEAFLRSRLS